MTDTSLNIYNKFDYWCGELYRKTSIDVIILIKNDFFDWDLRNGIELYLK